MTNGNLLTTFWLKLWDLSVTVKLKCTRKRKKKDIVQFLDSVVIFNTDYINTDMKYFTLPRKVFEHHGVARKSIKYDSAKMYDPVRAPLMSPRFYWKKVSWVAASKNIRWHIARRRPTHVRVFPIGTRCRMGKIEFLYKGAIYCEYRLIYIGYFGIF